MDNRVLSLCVFFGSIILVLAFTVVKFRLLALFLLAMCIALSLIMLDKTLKEFFTDWKTLFIQGFNNIKQWLQKQGRG